MDLQPFADIDPCGFPGLEVTQLSDLGVTMSLERAGETLAPILVRTLRPPTP
jgi:lipoyl(octanoyl) transferase